MTGLSDVAQVVFVRKRPVKIQYFRTTIAEEQRDEFGRLVDDTIRRIESAQFLPHSGIRLPQNPCTCCPYVGLCLGRTWLKQCAFGVREMILACLTSLRTCNPPMLPKLDKKRAQFVLMC